jgi:hypothetical protein
MGVPTTIDEFKQAYPGDKLDWIRITGNPRFDYPIDYSVAVLHVDPKEGRIDFLSRWEPNHYCHYHRHLGETTVLVIEGEQNVVEEKSGTETIHKARRPGFFARNPGGDVHMEYGGPEGALVYFSCKAVGDKVFDVLTKEGKVLNTATVQDFVSGAIKGSERPAKAKQA